MLGSPSTPLPAHAYRPPNTEQPKQVFTPPAATAPQLAAAMPADQPADPRWAILAEWLIHHGSAWVQSDGLHRQVRQLIDPQERTAAIRQRVQKLTGVKGSGLRMESEVIGNPIRHRLYRVVADRP
jgi:hypothetical protein